MTLLLSRSDVAQLLDIGACLEALQEGFLSPPRAIEPQRVRTDLPGRGTATALIPGLIEGVHAYTVKVNAKFPHAQPALRGVVCLHDLDTGELLAVLDSTSVTAWRTGLSAALATHHLARADARRVTVVGAGAQADLVMRGLACLRPWEDLRVCDLDPRRAEQFARRHGGTAIALDPELGNAPWNAVRDADIVVLATWSHAPLLDDGDVMPGAHVTSLGADEPGKAELSATLLEASRVVVDDMALSVAMGALGTAGLAAADTAGTLSQVLRDTVAGRRSDTDVTVYTPVGLPWQDLALSWLAYRRASATDVGHRFDFLR